MPPKIQRNLQVMKIRPINKNNPFDLSTASSESAYSHEYGFTDDPAYFSATESYSAAESASSQEEDWNWMGNAVGRPYQSSLNGLEPYRKKLPPNTQLAWFWKKSHYTREVITMSVGNRVQVKEAFQYEGHIRLEKGWQGKVTMVDDEGDVKIKFLASDDDQWVLKKDFHRLKKLTMETYTYIPLSLSSSSSASSDSELLDWSVLSTQGTSSVSFPSSSASSSEY